TTPLHDVTFCVIDLETTGASPAECTITEVGAAKFRGGECLGTFQTLVNPGVPIPPFITLLTGITQAMVGPAPPVRQVLPALLEFVERSVLVGHNVRFDISFLDAALLAGDRARLGMPVVDTVTLARRLLGEDDDVMDCRLGTLAARFGLAHQPTHRALDDALATADLLHLLLERAGPLGVTELDDLLRLPSIARRPYATKLRLTARLPRAPGVYVFRDGQGQPLYVGSAPDLRTRVRSLFTVRSGPRLRTIGPVLAAAHGLDHLVCCSSLEADVLAVRLVHALEPRYNRANWRGYRYVREVGGRSPRLAVARSAVRAGPGWLGPLRSSGAARAAIAALTAALGDGAPAAERLAAAVAGDGEAVLGPLRRRAGPLVEAGRDGEATAAYDGLEALERALRRQHRIDALRRAERIVVELPSGAGAELQRGRLVRAWPDGNDPLRRLGGAGAGGAGGGRMALPPLPEEGPVPLDMVDELAVVARWLDRHADQVRLVHVSGVLAGAVPGGSGGEPGGLRSQAC
ncbi:MAG TPA: exonuclease domain-containing protein, partial [Acidimicrobiales bacterium]|nr:exonuclease domain-containing protein [Acidimicrobiales bacterium]